MTPETDPVVDIDVLHEAVTGVLSDIANSPGNSLHLAIVGAELGGLLAVKTVDGKPALDLDFVRSKALRAHGILSDSPKSKRKAAALVLDEAIAAGRHCPLPMRIGPRAGEADRALAVEVERQARQEAAREVIRRRKHGERATMASKLLTHAELSALPGLEPLIDGVLFKSSIAMLFGLPGSYKSFLAIAFACSIATGRKWMGRTVEGGPTLIIAAEGAAGLNRRVDAWAAGWHDGKAVEGLTILPEAVNLSDEAQVDELAALNAKHGFALIVIDTWARSLGGADENSASATSLLVENVERIKRAHAGSTVLVVHHRGKSGTDPRGSIALLGAVDTALSMSGDRNAITLEATKQKDIEGGVVETLEAVKSVAVDSLVLQRRAGSITSGEDLPERHAESLAIFRGAFAATGSTRVEFRTVLQSTGIPYSVAYRHIDTLINSKRLVWEKGKLSLPPTDLDPYPIARPTERNQS